MTKSYSEFSKMNEEAEGGMYLQNIDEIISSAKEIKVLISPEDDLEAWVQDKIVIAHHNMDAILGYLKFKGANDISIDSVTQKK